MRGGQVERVLDFLRRTESDTLYLVGDVVDGWALRRSWYWPQAHNDVVQRLLWKARKGTEVVHAPGNHDGFVRYLPAHRPPLAFRAWTGRAEAAVVAAVEEAAEERTARQAA